MAKATKLGEVAWAHLTPKEDRAGGAPAPRSGHSINFSPEIGKAIIFGGCGTSADGKTQEVFNETWFLQTGDQPQWELVDVMGDVPQPRWRHTATLLPDKTMLVFGGLNKGKRFNDTFVLDVQKSEWNIRECNGTPPPPRSHHTANLITFDPEPNEETGEPEGEVKHKVCIVGGYGGPGTTRDFYMDVHMLELDSWTWVRIQNVRGPQPKPRSDHCSCLSRGFLIVSGGRGWSTGKTDPGFYDDINVLDIKKSKRASHHLASPISLAALSRRHTHTHTHLTHPHPPSSLSLSLRSGVGDANRVQPRGRGADRLADPPYHPLEPHVHGDRVGPLRPHVRLRRPKVAARVLQHRLGARVRDGRGRHAHPRVGVEVVALRRAAAGA